LDKITVAEIIEMLGVNWNIENAISNSINPLPENLLSV
jgi:hypothetical protein